LASERDRLLEALESILSMPELDSVALPEEPGELYPDPVVVGLSFMQRPTAERIERLKHKIVLMRKRADALDARVGHTVQERDALSAELAHIKSMLDGNLVQQLKAFGAKCDRAKAELAKVAVERDALKALVNPDNKRTLACGTCGQTALQVCTHICDAVQSPIHPAYARLAEAAQKWAEGFGGQPPHFQHNPKLRELLEAINALPSPLPRVVTCGTCRHASAGLVAPGVLRCKLRAFDTRVDGYCDKGEAMP
jgi:hypothetical protein